jgi:hypothetical protein
MNEWKSQDAQRRGLKGSKMLDLQAVENELVKQLRKADRKEDPRATKCATRGGAGCWQKSRLKRAKCTKWTLWTREKTWM